MTNSHRPIDPLEHDRIDAPRSDTDVWDRKSSPGPGTTGRGEQLRKCRLRTPLPGEDEPVLRRHALTCRCRRFRGQPSRAAPSERGILVSWLGAGGLKGDIGGGVGCEPACLTALRCISSFPKDAATVEITSGTSPQRTRTTATTVGRSDLKQKCRRRGSAKVPLPGVSRDPSPES